MDPTFEGFISWVRVFMGVPASVMADDSPFLPIAYNLSIAVVLNSSISGGGLDLVPSPQPAPVPAPFNGSPSIYALAVYNLASDWLVRIAVDDPDAEPPPANAPTYWQNLRSALGVGASIYGFIQSSGDQGTSASKMIPKQVQDMTLANLMSMQTPWGRAYLALAGQWGKIWGLS